MASALSIHVGSISVRLKLKSHLFELFLQNRARDSVPVGNIREFNSSKQDLQLTSPTRLWNQIVGGAESCFVSLPLSLIQTLQSGYLPPVLALELPLGRAPLACGMIGGQYAECISLIDRTLVRLREVSNLPKATLVTIEPFTEDDWEVLVLNSELSKVLF